MRSVLLGSLATLLIVAAIALQFVGSPKNKPDPPSASLDRSLTQKSVEAARVFPKEPVKDKARRVGGEGFGTVEIENDTIARLPARPLPPRTPRPEPTKLPPVPIALQRPLIKQPGHLQTGEVIVRLAGIISPALEQKCGETAKTRPCGRKARTALRKFIRSRTTICILPREPQKEAVEAQCTVGGKDVAEWLVSQGWAIAENSSRYEEAAKLAREKKRGLWQDDFGADLLLKSEGPKAQID